MSSNVLEQHTHARPHSSFGLLVAAAGVVYGDIGTSPLYTLKEVFAGHYGVQVNPEGVYGILSLVLWSLLWVVSLKYVMFMLRADNGGEGGVMALTALARRATAAYPRLSKLLVLLGLFGTALFYGDSMIPRPSPCYPQSKVWMSPCRA
jgi:KUP system potassium uptake protein